MTNKVEVFSLDLGNGWVKARSSKVTMVIPSYIAKLSSTGTSSTGSLSTDNDNVNVFMSQLDDKVEYIMGEGIKSVVDPTHLIDIYTHEKRYEQLRFKLMCEFILAELASDFEKDSIDVMIVTGMPSNEIKTKDEKTLRSNLEGKHLISRNGKQIVVNVVSIRVIEQPLGTLMNLYLNDKHQIHKDHKDTVTIIDFGSGTTIFDTFKNLKRLPDKSDTLRTGQHSIYDAVKDEVTKEYNLKTLTRSHVEDAFKDEFTITLSKRKNYECEDIAKKTMKSHVDSWISQIDAKITSRDSIDKFIITGGGVNNVGDIFKEKFGEDITVIENPQIANVNGYYKFGLMLLNKERVSKK